MKSKLLFALALLASTPLHARYYDPTTGTFISRDPMEDDSLGNLYAPFERNPGTFSDPTGLLSRKQVQWIGEVYFKNKDFDIGAKGVTSPVIEEMLKKFKVDVKVNYPDAKFKEGAWSEYDDAQFQVLLDSIRNSKKICNMSEFPGNTWDPITDLKEIQDLIKKARALYDLPAVDDYMLMSWMMMESSWSPSKSPYGTQSGQSTAQGLSQITRSTWNDYLAAGLLPESMKGWSWDEATSSPEKSIAAGMAVLNAKIKEYKSESINKGLEHYFGSQSKDENRAYSQKINEGADFLRKALEGKGHDPSATRKALSDLDKLLHN